MTDAQDLENELTEDAILPSEDTPSPKESLGADSEQTPSDDSALSADLEALIKEISKLKETAARSQADYKNLVARTERERGEMTDFITERVAIKILPSIDNLERLISGTPESEARGALYDGVKSTLQGLVKTLESIGVTAFESIGNSLDPAFHEAVARVKGEEGVVISEFEKGYTLREKVIRHAKVTVGDGSSE